MSPKFETPANNDEQSNHSERDAVATAMLLSCAFDGPPVSSKNDNTTPTAPASGLGNLLRSAENTQAQTGSDTTSNTVGKALSSIGNLIQNKALESQKNDDSLKNVLPNLTLQGLLNESAKPSDGSMKNPGNQTSESAIQNILKNGKPSDGSINKSPESQPSGSAIQNILKNGKPSDDSINKSPESQPSGSAIQNILKNGKPSDDSINKSPENQSAGSAIQNILKNGKPSDDSSNKSPENHKTLPSIIDLINGKARPQESSGSSTDSLPSIKTLPHTKGSENSASPPVGFPQILPGSGGDHTGPRLKELPQPSHSGGAENTLPPVEKLSPKNDGRTELPNNLLEKVRPPIDRSPKFKFPEDKPMDAKTADEMVDKVSKWMKESVDKDGNLQLDANVLARLKDTLNYGIDHGAGGLKEIVEKLNKKLEGTGIEIKTDGKVFGHYRTCMPDIERGDHLGDFIGFDVLKNGKKVDSNLVKVGPGIFDR